MGSIDGTLLVREIYMGTIAFEKDMEVEKQLPTYEEVASNIQLIAEAMEKIKNSRLYRRAIRVLLYDQLKGKVKMSDISEVLDGLELMDKVWLKSLPVTPSTTKGTNL